MDNTFHKAYILLGSNIFPVKHLRMAINLLCNAGVVSGISTVWETTAVGSSGPNFLNAAVVLDTNLTLLELKDQILLPIETCLGRVRTSDKNAPRTIDLDIIVFDDVIQDTNVWSRVHIAVPMAELTPDVTYAESGKRLKEVATDLLHSGWAKPHPEIHLEEHC